MNQRPKFMACFLCLALLLIAVLAILFGKSFQAGQVLFVNDTTLGQMAAPTNRLPGAFVGIWDWGAWVGVSAPALAPTITSALHWIFPPEILLKFYAPFTLLFVGFCAWVFFRQLQFNPVVTVLCGLAAGLNTRFFSVACWGQGHWNIAAGMTFLALAALCSKSIQQLWAKGILAGLAIGVNLMEGFDVGCILAIFAGFFAVASIFFESRFDGRKVLTVLGLEVSVIFFSVFIAAHSISSLIDTQVTGVVGTAQDVETKEQRWGPATQWSLPKAETLRVIIPGLFGYCMIDRIPGPDKSSAYWGNVGQDPRITDLESDDPAARTRGVEKLILPPDIRQALEIGDRETRVKAINALTAGSTSAMRFTGNGEFAGVLICLLAFFALANTARGAGAPYSISERREMWFWAGAALFALLAAWGRYGFLYRLLYELPYVSTIRNPIKFMYPFHVASLILAGYGLEAISRQYLKSPASEDEIVPPAPRDFERKWILASVALALVALAAIFVFALQKPRLEEYLTEQGFNSGDAANIAGFSLKEARWFAVLLLISMGLLAGITGGNWRGWQTRLLWVCFGGFIVIDAVRADLPWIRYFNYQTEYASNAVLDFLQDKPYEHRVTGRISPRGLGAGLFTSLGRLYSHWQQNDFPYRSIESLDFAQFSRMPMLDDNYLQNFALQGNNLYQCDVWLAERLWELSNTRYILTSSELLPLLNRFAEPGHSFRVKMSFNVAPKPEAISFSDPGDTTIIPVDNGPFALIEFDNPLPRAKLFSHWETISDDASLKLLASRDFDPAKTMLIADATPVKENPGEKTSDAGSVEITEYQPHDVKITAKAAAPCVLLLNDRFTPAWKVWVDQKPAELLRCNYLMRGVYLTAGEHTVEFRYQPNMTAFYLSLCAWGIGILTAGYLIVNYRRRFT